MILLCESRSNASHWAIVDQGAIVRSDYISGLNPFFKTRREISHAIRLELPDIYFKNRYDRIFFYGSGCSSDDRRRMVESSLVAQFKAPAEIESDLLGAARGMLQHSPGIACILATGSNSCFYDGKEMVEHVRSGGYLLGDEGSSSSIGKALVSDIVKDLAPKEVADAFLDTMHCNIDDVMDDVYSQSDSNLVLSSYAKVLTDMMQHPYCRQLVYDAFMNFFQRNISKYDYKHYPLWVVGHTALAFREVFEQAAADFGVTIGGICETSIPGLACYHSAEN